MNRKIITVIFALGLMALLSPFVSSAAFAAEVALGVPEIEQEHSNWCWAAVSESVIEYYGQSVVQSDIADWAWSRTDCSTGVLYDWSHVCNTANYLYGTTGSVQNILNNWGVGPASTTSASELTWDALVAEIDAGTPFIMRFGWTSGGGHFLTAYGYDVGWFRWVLYMDPLPDRKSVV